METQPKIASLPITIPDGNRSEGEMEAKPKSPSLPIEIPGYDRELRYEVRREAAKVVIEAQFDFKEEESRYVLRSWLSEKRLARQQQEDFSFLLQTLTERKAVVDSFLEKFEHLRPSPTFRRGQPSSVVDWPKEVADLVFAALRTFGFDALRLSAADMRQVRHPDKKNIDSELLAALDRLGGIVGEILRDWQKRVREEIDVRKRRQFQGYLRYMGALFIPPTQGKRAGRIGVPDSEVWKRYYSNLFRCEQAKVLLKTLAHCPGCRRWQVRLQAVCERFAIPQDPKWWGFKEEAQVLRQLLFSKETAVLLTARHFSPIAEQTIRNILAR